MEPACKPGFISEATRAKQAGCLRGGACTAISVSMGIISSCASCAGSAPSTSPMVRAPKPRCASVQLCSSNSILIVGSDSTAPSIASQANAVASGTLTIRALSSRQPAMASPVPICASTPKNA